MTRRDDAGRSAPAVDLVLPRPVVQWKTVVLADDPAREPTVGRLREMRKKGLVADGVTVARRQGQRLRGRSTFYSVLAALSARCHRAGHLDDAAVLRDAASDVETRFAEKLAGYLSDRALETLPEAAFFAELAQSTADALAGWANLPDHVLAAAEVRDAQGQTARLEGTSGRGEPVSVDLPRALLERQALMTGDLVWVSTRLVGSAALVEVLPAIKVQLARQPDDGHSPLHLLPAFASQPARARSDEPGDDGLTASERAAQSAHFRATAGADLSANDLASLRRDAAAGLVPRRRFRPAG